MSTYPIVIIGQGVRVPGWVDKRRHAAPEVVKIIRGVGNRASGIYTVPRSKQKRSKHQKGADEDEEFVWAIMGNCYVAFGGRWVDPDCSSSAATVSSCSPCLAAL
jgi:hypothetical protein